MSHIIEGSAVVAEKTTSSLYNKPKINKLKNNINILLISTDFIFILHATWALFHMDAQSIYKATGLLFSRPTPQYQQKENTIMINVSVSREWHYV